MAILNFTGFEEGTNANQGNGSFDTQPFTGTAPTYDSTTKRTGSYSMRINSTGSGSDGSLQLPSTFQSNGISDTNSGSYATFYLNFYFRYATKPASLTEEIIGIVDTGGDLKAVIRINSAGKLQVYDYNVGTGTYTAVGSLGSTALSANTWYKIGFKLGSGASSAYEIQINDATEVSGTYSWTSTLNNMKVKVGMTNQNNQAIDYYLDDIVLKDDAFVSGAYEVKVIKPTANGSTMSWTDGGSPQDYTQVDDIPRGDISTNYVMCINSGAPNVALFTMQNCSDVGITGTILSLKARIQHRENATASSATRVRVRSSSTNSDSDAYNGTTSGQGRIRLLNTDPATGSAWTTGGIDAVEIGAVEDNNVRVRLGSVMGYVLYIPSTSVDYPITAAQGSFTLSGQSAALKVGRKIVAAYATFALTGQTTLLKIGRKITAAYGSFTLTGKNVALRSARKIVAVFGSFTLSGQTVILRYGKKMAATYGSFALTGQNVLLKLGRKMTAAQGSFTLSGQTALLKLGRTMQAVYGTFTLTGQDILLKLSWKMQAVYTTFTLNGQTVLLNLGRKITAAYGTFTLTGQSILFHIAVKMYAVYGSFTLTGQTVLFAVNGLYVKWTNAVKNTVATITNRTKNSSTWTNRDKTL